MTPKRKQDLDNNPDLPLTPEEVKEGWHFCYSYEKLVGPGMPEFSTCQCGVRPRDKEEPV